jgi:hypothetical protein
MDRQAKLRAETAPPLTGFPSPGAKRRSKCLPGGKQRGIDPPTFAKATAELPILRNFMDLINRQVGVYCDALSSFNGNKVRVERQIPRLVLFYHHPMRISRDT